MPLVIAAITALATVIGQLAAKALVGLGIGAVTYVGVSQLLDVVLLDLQNALISLPVEVIGFIGVLNVDRLFSLVFSAMAARAALAGVTAAGSLSRIR
jgi:uncharacterized protein DUF2523